MEYTTHVDTITEEKVAWLRLIRSENIGSVSFFSLLKEYGHAELALEELERRDGYKKVKVFSKAQAEDEIAQCQKQGVSLVFFNDVEYPDKLRNTYGPPPILSVHGNISALSRNGIAIVGTRNASANGCAFARKIAANIAEYDFNTISGLARGIDTYVHSSSLATGTVAVLAGGVDYVYPRQNQKLYEDIIESNNGAVVSERPLGFVPRAQHFPTRNRIIAGLSDGVLVVEAAQKSGSLITANYAMKEGRTIFAVPGFPFDPRSDGANFLLKRGAVLTRNAQDIVDGIHNPVPKQFMSRLFEDIDDYSSYEDESYENIADHKDLILSKLSYNAVAIDELAEQCDMQVSEVSSILLLLELEKKVERKHAKVNLVAEMEV